MTADIADRKLKSREDVRPTRMQRDLTCIYRVFTVRYRRLSLFGQFPRSTGNGARVFRIRKRTSADFVIIVKDNANGAGSSFERASFPPETLFPRRNLSRSTRSIFRSHPLARLRFSSVISRHVLSRAKRGRSWRCDATADAHSSFETCSYSCSKHRASSRLTGKTLKYTEGILNINRVHSNIIWAIWRN